MGELTWCKVFVTLWAVILMRSAAEPLYFLQDSPLTWENARNHCQVCFKDLVTVTYNASQAITRNLSSDYWIGLRKYFSSPSNSTGNDTSEYAGNSTGNSTSDQGVAWSRWANGDPLAFQNWYPGWPKFKITLPVISCCSCSCTCPAATSPMPTSVALYTTPNSTHFDATTDDMINTSSPLNSDIPGVNPSTNSIPLGSVFSTPAAPVASQCEKTPMLFPSYPDPNRDYIEDSCVVMLSSGSWVEKNCIDLHPFICYEDRFYGHVNVSNVTATTAVLTWQPVPSNISHYRLHVENSTSGTVCDVNLTAGPPPTLNYSLIGLNAGSLYHVTVFAVKCDRDMDDPQRVNFYTIPNKIKNLTVVSQTTTSITLNWNPPDDSVDYFRVSYNGSNTSTTTNYTEINSLIPGSMYVFSVYSEVNDSSRQSEPVGIQAYTKPDKVSNLFVIIRGVWSLTLNWTQPKGDFINYNVTAFPDQNGMLFRTVAGKGQTSCNITGLPAGTLININVTVLGYDNLMGEVVTTQNYTAPVPVTNLRLVTDNCAVYATWNYNTTANFTVDIWSKDGPNSTNYTSSPSFTFLNLKPATYYTVTVWSVVAGVKSPPVDGSNYTLPSPPTDANVFSKSRNQATFQWKAPSGITTGQYAVSLTSQFWGQNITDVTGNTNYTFSNLMSGTNYTFQVRTKTVFQQSDPATCTVMTDAQQVKYSFAMMCSSATALHCSDPNIQSAIIDKLSSMLHSHLDNNIFWNFTTVTSENLAP